MMRGTGIFAIMLAAACLAVSCAGTAEQKAAAPSARQADTLRRGDTREECLRSIRRARTDARGGLYRMYVFGPKRYDESFNRFLAGYLQTRYGIELIVYGNDMPGRDKCYSNEMDKILYNSFGPDILARAEQEARELLDSGR